MISVQEHEEVLRLERKRYDDMHRNLTIQLQHLSSALEEERRISQNQHAQIMELKWQQQQARSSTNANSQDEERENLLAETKRLKTELSKERAKHRIYKARHESSKKRKRHISDPQPPTTQQETTAVATAATATADSPASLVAPVAVTAHGRLNKHDLKWKSHFEQLKAFHTQHGHCNVPMYRPKQKDGNKEERSLALWVCGQRTAHRKLREGKTSYITPERIRLLNGLGFQWQVTTTSTGAPLTTTRVPWKVRMEQLKAYAEQHGHVHVPQSYKKANGLGEFVTRMRREYTLGMLKQERIDELNAMNFRWRKVIKNKTTNQQQTATNGGATAADAVATVATGGGNDKEDSPSKQVATAEASK